MRIASVLDRNPTQGSVISSQLLRLSAYNRGCHFNLWKSIPGFQLPGFTPFSTNNQNEEARCNAASGRISVHDGTRPERLGMGVPAPQPRLPCRCDQAHSPTGGCASDGRLQPSLGVAKSWRPRTAAALKPSCSGDPSYWLIWFAS